MSANTGFAPRNTNALAVDTKVNEGMMISSPSRIPQRMAAISRADVQEVVETAIGGKAATQVIEGEKRFDLIVRFAESARNDFEEIRNILVLTPAGCCSSSSFSSSCSSPSSFPFSSLFSRSFRSSFSSHVLLHAILLSSASPYQNDD
jgi:hypothetical protein